MCLLSANLQIGGGWEREKASMQAGEGEGTSWLYLVYL